MAARFLGKTALAELVPLRSGGRPVLEQYEMLRSMLTARFGAAEAELFAEPIVTWGGETSGSVSWYAEAIGEAEPLRGMPTERRERLEAGLRDALARLSPLLGEPEAGPLLLAALVIASPDGIRAVDDRVILTDWGLAPASAPPSADPRARLAGSPLGRFVVPAAAVDRAAATPAASTLTAATPVAAPAANAPPMMIRTVERTGWNWWFLPAILGIASLFLVLGLWVGSRMVAERLAARPTTVELLDENAVRQAIERQKQENVALEREVEERRKALEGNVCVADPAQLPRLGPDRGAAVPPAAVPPPPGGNQFHGSLAELLKQSVVLVLAPLDRGVSTGSGFFVTPELIVTNRHVIERGDPERIFVTNGKLGQLTRARIVAQTGSSTIGKLDVALLRLDRPAPVQPLALSTTVKELDAVVAAGFPAVTVKADETYERLLQGGDATAVPPVILTDGKISAVQETADGLKIMPHTAPISGGNSGGPLVDACGRVVGINTFISVDREQATTAKWAQKIDQVLPFLAQHGTSLTALTDECNPAATPAAPQAAPSPPAPQAAPAAPAPQR